MGTNKEIEELTDRLMVHVDEMIQTSGASQQDLKVVADRLNGIRLNENQLLFDQSGFSPTQEAFSNAILVSIASGELEKILSDQSIVENQRIAPRRTRIRDDINRGVNASRLLLFVMDPESVEEKVGDALERLGEIQRRYGSRFGVWHYRWTIGCLFLQAAWKKTLVSKVIDACLGRLNGNTD